ncbi:glycosyltransferase family 2 protein [Singulisphaera sp. PoT]|uniref:glycosyltransferase family 2 protein n=1 Tax=Singulisphaera sp. PoT TaxID=3411797 RepID=UPI003BF54445
MSHGSSPGRGRIPSLISIVLPVYNEKDVLDTLTREIESAVSDSGSPAELIFVDDGSRDGSGAILDRLASANPRIRVLHLSRNFGHQAALQAGLSHAAGNVVIVMDSDLQDDPRAILRFLEKWEEGFDVVYAIRTARKESPPKRLLFHLFYRLLNLIARIPMPSDAGNFGLMDRRVADEIVRLLDRDRYFAGLRSWVGFRQTGVEVARGQRYDDRPRVSLFGLVRLAKSAIFSFSTFPLMVFYAIGSLSMAVFLGLATFTLYHKLFTGLAIPGWTSITMVSSFFGAMNALGIAVLGEYVIRIYEQVRSRPLYLVERKVNFEPNPENPGDF